MCAFSSHAEKPRCWINVDQRRDPIVEQEQCCASNRPSNPWRSLNPSSSSDSKRQARRNIHTRKYACSFFFNARYFRSDIRDIKRRGNLLERLMKIPWENLHGQRERGGGERGGRQHSGKGKANCVIFQTKRANRRNVVDVREFSKLRPSLTFRRN